MIEPMPKSRQEILRTLQQRVEELQTERLHAAHAGEERRVWTGLPALESLLPMAGFQPGTLVEWVGDEGSGASTLAALVGRAALAPDKAKAGLTGGASGGALIVVDRQRRFYPPAAARMGFAPQQLIVLCPENVRDHRWALVQALGCPGVTAVLDWSEQLDGRTFRRLQLAAERGQSLGLLVRPTTALGEPSWSQVQLLVRAQSPPPASTATASPITRGRRLRVEVIRAQGEQAGRWVELEINDETHTVHLVASMASPTLTQRPFKHHAGERHASKRRAEAS